MDPVILLSLLVMATAAASAVSWYLITRRFSLASQAQRSSESRLLLRLMSRADHALDNYITSIQDHLSVLGEELPMDVERWDVSREAISQAAALLVPV